MRSLGITAACVLLSAAATAANAVTINGVGHTNAQLVRSSASNGTTSYGDGETDAIWASGGKGASFEANVTTSTNHVSFKSGVAASGPYSIATATSIADVTVANDSSHAINIHSFGSTIIPAGLGFYLQDRSTPLVGTNIFTGYGEAPAGNSFDDLPAESIFAIAGFDFEITDDFDDTLYSLSGQIALLATGSGVTTIYDLNDAEGVLSGFTGVHGTPDNPLAYAFAWDATNISVGVNHGHLLPEESLTLHYRATVNTTTYTNCISPTICLVGYSGFGDPIGRGGGVDSLGVGAYDLGGPITDIVFNPVDFDPVTFGRGDITNGSGTPEPATWAVMILGFGLAGAAMRRRRAMATATA
jgi:hypothetical protein